MDLESILPSAGSLKCCSCNCCQPLDAHLKRKFDLINDICHATSSQTGDSSVAHVGIENECAVMRESLRSQQQTIHLLSAELEEERNASASAANEAMSMILRLQREKAEIQMEARQFKCYADEKMAHDQLELLALEDMLHNKDLIIYSLMCEVESYKHRLMHFGYTDHEAEEMLLNAGAISPSNSQMSFANMQSSVDYMPLDYPSLKCDLNETHVLRDIRNDAPSDLDKYAFGEKPSREEDFQNMDREIHQPQRTAINNQMDEDYCSTKHFIEKATGSQPTSWSSHDGRLSNGSSDSLLGVVKEVSQEEVTFLKVDYASDTVDDTNDRVYTVDSVQVVPCDEVKINIGISNEYLTASEESLGVMSTEETDIKKLYIRLQALEADRESLRQEISSMRANKAQMMLMKEMSHLLYRKTSTRKPLSVRKRSLFRSFSVMSLMKWLVSFIWRRKPRRSKYMFDASINNLGLLLLLDQSPCTMRRQVSRSFPFFGQ